MPGKTVESHQADPLVHWVQEIAFSFGQQVILKRDDLPVSIRVIKNQQFLGNGMFRAEVNRSQSTRDILQRRRRETGAGQDDAQGIDIATEGNPVH